MSAPKIVLSYWPSSGRLTPAIFALTLGGIPFERENLTHQEWATASSDLTRFPLGDIPVMSVDGKVISQSYAIAHYAGVLTGLWPKDAFGSARAMEVMLTAEEIVSGPWGVNYMSTVMLPSNPDLTAEKQKELREGPFKAHLLFYARRLNEIILQNGDNGFTVGDSLSVADFIIWQMYAMFTSGDVDHLPTTILDEFTGMRKVAATVGAVEALKGAIAATRE